MTQWLPERICGAARPCGKAHGRGLCRDGALCGTALADATAAESRAHEQRMSLARRGEQSVHRAGSSCELARPWDHSRRRLESPGEVENALTWMSVGFLKPRARRARETSGCSCISSKLAAGSSSRLMAGENGIFVTPATTSLPLALLFRRLMCLAPDAAREDEMPRTLLTDAATGFAAQPRTAAGQGREAFARHEDAPNVLIMSCF